MMGTVCFSRAVIRLTQMTHPLHQTNCPFCNRGICRSPRDIKDKHHLPTPISSAFSTASLEKHCSVLIDLGPCRVVPLYLQNLRCLCVMRRVSSFFPQCTDISSKSIIGWEWMIVWCSSWPLVDGLGWLSHCLIWYQCFKCVTLSCPDTLIKF